MNTDSSTVASSVIASARGPSSRHAVSSSGTFSSSVQTPTLTGET